MRTLTKMFLLCCWSLCFMSIALSSYDDKSIDMILNAKQFQQNINDTDEAEKQPNLSKVNNEAKEQPNLKINNSLDAKKAKKKAYVEKAKSDFEAKKVKKNIYFDKAENSKAKKKAYVAEMNKRLDKKINPANENFEGPRLQVNPYSRIEVAPENGSRDGSVSVEICSTDSWPDEIFYILLDTTNWYAYGSSGWVQHSAGELGCETFTATVPAGGYVYILGDAYGDSGATATVSVD